MAKIIIAVKEVITIIIFIIFQIIAVAFRFLFTSLSFLIVIATQSIVHFHPYYLLKYFLAFQEYFSHFNLILPIVIAFILLPLKLCESLKNQEKVTCLISQVPLQ